MFCFMDDWHMHIDKSVYFRFRSVTKFRIKLIAVLFVLSLQPVLDLHPIPTRKSITLCDADFILNPLVTTSRAVNNPRENIRMITSLPVSPSSSPLRQHGPAHKSCFLSPPHPTYTTAVGPSSYSIGDYTGYPVRSNPRYISNPWLDSSLLKAQTPGASPRTRPI
ncbi:hypothetical protein Patl1_27926 [Pistacia atlantica]|uniref:Uncharacterized protein n=1 Tax=Pistacia atlantica TaxID=434234 RepID=A0ACC1BEP2_9ROSI|nr:hypothetical protein Patl1_27926 [Pistacia atlantica]